MRAAVLVVVVALGACTEPNPFAGGESSSGTMGTESTTMMSTSVTETSTTTMSTTTMSDTTIGTTASDTTVDTTETGDPTGTTTADPICEPATHLCVPETPAAWQGPAAVIASLVSDSEPTCAADFPVASALAFGELSAAAATCDCACEESADAACTTVVLVVDNTSNCNSPTSTWNLDAAAGCDEDPSAGTGQYWRATAEIDEGTCTPMPTEQIDPAVFTDRVTICGAAADVDSTGCADAELCLPIPASTFDGRICVWQSGVLECPDPWTEREVLFQDIADDRDCTECTCGDVVGDCSGSVALGGGACGGAAVGNITIGNCTQETDAVGSADVSGTPAPVNPSCPPSNSDPIGDAEGTSAITLCCLP